MFIIFNAIVSSLDGLVIGIGLKLSKIKLTLKNNIVILLTNLIIYSLIIYIYYAFNFKFMTTTITTFLYLILAWNALKTKEHESFNKPLTLKNMILLSLAHSLDGGIISLNFVYTYNPFFIIILFSLSALILLLVGYYCSSLFKDIKKSNYISSLLFFLLALINLFL